jgi:hypothetical protein
VIFFNQFKNYLSKFKNPEYQMFAEKMRSEVNYQAIRDYSASIVSISDSLDLLSQFIQLSVPKIFICGENNNLPYLQTLRQNNIPVFEIPGSNHFVLYSNLSATWNVLNTFYQQLNLET